ncbi:MAG: hypothetical protein HKO92_07025 [Flavobacteriaceae bacterium]|nr:hypothetical protein [Flavobacteriaceae bacterium]
MGTNYYISIRNNSKTDNKYSQLFEPPCVPLHIGKSSKGWCFSLRVYPEMNINSYNDWIYYILNLSEDSQSIGVIFDEYEREIKLTELTKIITERKSERHWDTLLNNPLYDNYSSLDDFLNKNSAIKGPNNLLRHKIDNFCVGHGDGTYDYIKGEFS